MDKTKVTQKVDMFNRVNLVCESKIAIVGEVPELKLSFADFQGKVSNVKKLMREVSTDDGGLAEGKELVWQDLAVSLNIICSGLRAYASKRRDPELAVRAKFSPSVFLNERSADAVERAMNLIALVEANLPSLEGFNVTKAKVEKAKALAVELDQVNPKPTTARTIGKAVRKELFAATRDTSLLLSNEMDALVDTLLDEQPLFVQEYRNARRLQRTGIRHQQAAPQPPLNLAGKLSNTVETINIDTVEVPQENGVAV